jgi:DNA-binding CsgD family transcriptional regulator
MTADTAVAYRQALCAGTDDLARSTAAALNIDPAGLAALVDRLVDLRLLADPRPASPPAAHLSPVRVLGDQDRVRAALHAAIRECRDEVLIVKAPDAAWDATVDTSLADDIGGVGVRVLYQHCVRGDLAALARIRAVAAAGAEVRTVDRLPSAFVVVDRAVVLVPDGAGAVELREPATARLLAGVFERGWTAASPLPPDGPGYGDVADEVRASIVELLAAGHTDQAVARRVGLSVRSCRRHIAALFKDLGAVSRFQAGARAVQAGLLPGGSA